MMLKRTLTPLLVSVLLWGAMATMGSADDQTAALQAERQRLSAIESQHSDELLGLPGVNAVGVGPSRGDPNKMVIIVEATRATPELRAKIAASLGNTPFELTEAPPNKAL